MSLEERFRKTKSQIPSHVKLVAVSKRQPLESIEALYHLGQRDFGENYVQELIEKATELSQRGCTEIRWHFIGHLQRNKVKSLIPYIDTLQTVDSLRLLEELKKRVDPSQRLKIYLQVNIDRETSKGGIDPSEIGDLIELAEKSPEVSIQGLMCIPDPKKNQDGESFVRLVQLKEELGLGDHWKLSMGMSQDFLLAIDTGSDCVRIGTQIFGPRTEKVGSSEIS